MINRKPQPKQKLVEEYNKEKRDGYIGKDAKRQLGRGV